MKQKYLKLNFKTACWVVLSIVLISGCAGPKDRGLYSLSRISYPRFSDDLGFDGLEHSVLKSIEYLNKFPPEKVFMFDKDSYSASHMIKSLQTFLDFVHTKPSDKQLKGFIKSNFKVYKSVGNGWRKHVLFTGYYEPLLQGSLYKTEEYRYPILARPEDLMRIDLSLFSTKFEGEKIVGRYDQETIVPYYDRREIEQEGVLDGKTEVLAWVNDPIDLFFLQIQGSGKILLDSGQSLNVHYHETNGQPYRSIGKL